jgi:hypothetical protein
VKQFEQIASANGVDQHRAIFDWPLLGIHAIATAADLNTNYARTKRLEQHLRISSIVAQIGDNESIPSIHSPQLKWRDANKIGVGAQTEHGSAA